MILGQSYKGNDVEYVDIAASEEAKKKMRELMGDPKGLAPQIFNGDTYCGVRDEISTRVCGLGLARCT